MYDCRAQGNSAEKTTLRANEFSWVREQPFFCEAPLKSLVKSNPLQPSVPTLGSNEISRILTQVKRVQDEIPALFLEYQVPLANPLLKGQHFILRTANTFPSSSGIASSASSFAAVTLVAAASLALDKRRFNQVFCTHVEFRRQLAQLSRQGSGSSCRSFEGPWVTWDKRVAHKVDLPGIPPLAHFVIVVQAAPKKVSSSAAHHLVLKSPLWQGRAKRVRNRLQDFYSAAAASDLSALAHLVWCEFWEMHSLFHTSQPPFSYWEPDTLKGLAWFSKKLQDPDPPIVTLDAGPNLHVLVVHSKRAFWKEQLTNQFQNSILLEDEASSGAYLEDDVESL